MVKSKDSSFVADGGDSDKADTATDSQQSPTATDSKQAPTVEISKQAAAAARTETPQKRKLTHEERKALAIEYTKRCVFLLVGLFIMSFGVALSIRADLGTSPISSVPQVLTLITSVSVGTTTVIVNTVIVLIQILLLRRRFKLIQLLQIPVCAVFGYLIDFALFIMGDFTLTAYWAQWLVCIAGIVLVAIGVSIEVAANVTTLAGEGLALALCKVFPKIKFGYMKVICDCMLVVIAVILSFSFLHALEGVREGTVAAAVFVGLIAKQLSKVTVPLANRLFRGKKQADKAA